MVSCAPWVVPRARGGERGVQAHPGDCSPPWGPVFARFGYPLSLESKGEINLMYWCPPRALPVLAWDWEARGV